MLLISLTQAVSMVDRQIVAILLPQIKADMEVGDAEMGLLYGTVFGLFYALFSLPLGRLADGCNRTRLLSISVGAWSAMTALGGMANSFGVLALSRLGVGIGEASVQPAGFSLISDYFRKERRGAAAAVFAASITVGLGASLWIGGTTADWWERTYTAADAPFGLRGWQAAFIVAASPGLVLTVLLARLPEPVRGAADGIATPPDPAAFRASWDTLLSITPGCNWLVLRRLNASSSVWAVNIVGLIAIIATMVALTDWTDSVRVTVQAPLMIGNYPLSGNALQWTVTGIGLYVVLNWLQTLKLRDAPAFVLIAKTPSLTLLFIIAALQSAVNYGVMAWTPSFMIKQYGMSPAEVGLKFGALVAVVGTAGPLIAGPISDWLAARVRGGRVYVTLYALTVSPILAFWAYNAATPAQFYPAFGIYCFTLAMWLPPVYASLMDLVLPRMRGVAASFYVLTMTILGLGLGPYAVGLISDVNGGNLGTAILSIYWLAPPMVIAIIILARRYATDEAGMINRARAAGELV
ncbi:MFS transporter [Sphingomonas turrisvirgatae]|uniref:MFS transporter n=1 Tax=Sphingomonas turrisvirgatae TaxID=1888892 RepID=UPI001F4DB040|nr:MFS transporter [Sphingomonas turrisvirgatae]